MKLGFFVKVLIAVVAIAGAGYVFISSLQPLAVVATAKRSVAVRSVPGTVSVVADKEMFIRSDLGGRIEKSFLESGATVEEGDLLIALDLGDIELGIEKVGIEIEAAKLSLEQGSSRQYDLVSVKERLENTERSFNEGTASRNELEARRRDLREIEQAIEADINAKEVRLASLENELKRLQRNKEKMSLRAPMDGIITEVLAYRGELLGSGQEVAKMISLDRIVEVKVSEENFSGIAVGQIARVKFLGYGDETFDAKVSKTLPVADPLTQRYTVHLEVDIDRQRLFPGLTGEATITLDEREQALIIPGAAIIGNRVFVVEDGVVAMREIEKGFGSMTNVEIVSGLEEGEQVIVEDLDLFKVGDSVRVEARNF